MENTVWSVYVLVSDATGRTYVGASVDVHRRLLEHNGEGNRGAKATRAGRPWRVGAIYGPYGSRGEAQAAEARIKRLRGSARLSYSDSSANANSGDAHL